MSENAKPSRDAYQAKLETIVREVCQKETISMGADLVHDLNLDSLAMMRLIIEVEEAFGVVIGGKEIQENVLKTPSSLLDFILSK